MKNKFWIILVLLLFSVNLYSFNMCLAQIISPEQPVAQDLTTEYGQWSAWVMIALEAYPQEGKDNTELLKEINEKYPDAFSKEWQEFTEKVAQDPELKKEVNEIIVKTLDEQGYKSYLEKDEVYLTPLLSTDDLVRLYGERKAYLLIAHEAYPQAGQDPTLLLKTIESNYPQAQTKLWIDFENSLQTDSALKKSVNDVCKAELTGQGYRFFEIQGEITLISIQQQIVIPEQPVELR